MAQFENIILKAGASGELVRVRDVARVELGAQNYAWYAQQDGNPTSMLGAYALAVANAVKVENGVVVTLGGRCA